MFNFSQLTKKLVDTISKSRLKITKRILFIFALFWILKLAFVFLVFAAGAASNEPNQVKCHDDNTVYYLDYARKIKKPYLNEQAFLSYGNKWSDVKTIDCSKIENWSFPQIIKSQGSDQIYAVEGITKKLIGNSSSAAGKGYDLKMLLTLSKIDFNSYENSNYFWSGEKGKVEAELINVNKTVKKVNQGAAKEKIISVKIQEVSGNENIIVKKIVFANNATTSLSVLDNIALKNKNNKNLAYKASIVNDRLIIELAEGCLITRNNYDVISLFADFNFKASGYLQLAVKKDDILVKGEKSQGSLPINNMISYPERSNCDANCDKFLIASNIVVVKNTTPAKNTKVYKGQKDARLGTFEIANNGQDIYVKQVKVAISVASNAAELANKVNLVNDGNNKILATLNGGSLYNRDAYFTLPDNYLLKSKGKLKIAITSTINNEVQTGENYQVYIKEIVVKNTKANTYLTYQTDIKGSIINAAKPSLYVASGDFTAKDILVAGKKKAKIASYKIVADANEGAKIKSLTFNKAAGFLSINYSNGFENLVLYKNDSAVSKVIKEPNSQNYTFDDLNISVEAGKSVDISLRADISENATGQVSTVLDNAKAVTKDNKVGVEVYNDSVKSIAPEIVRNTVYIGSISGGSAAANTKNNILGKFKISTQSAEDIKLKSATIETDGCNGGLNSKNGFKNIKFGYIDENGKLKTVGSTISSPKINTNKISLNGFTIKQNSELSLNLYADANSDLVNCSFGLKVTLLEAEGVSTKVKTYIDGYPTSEVQIAALGQSSSASTGNTNNSNTNTGNSSNSSSVVKKIKFLWPTTSHTVYYKFHDPKYPYVSEMQHEGIDVKASQGTTIRAAANGRVVTAYAGNMNDASYVVIDHGSGYSTVYGHLSVISVKVGQEVKAGDTIGKSGGTPGTVGAGQYSTGAHLHFEIRLNNVPVDPLKYLQN